MVSPREGILATLLGTGIRLDTAGSSFHVCPMLRQASQDWLSQHVYKSTSGSWHILPAKTGLSRPRARDWGRDPALNSLWETQHHVAKM